MRIIYPTQECCSLARSWLNQHLSDLSSAVLHEVIRLGLFSRLDLLLLLENHFAKLACAELGQPFEQIPILRLYGGSSWWLLSEILPKVPFFGFGLCEHGYGEPEITFVHLPTLAELARPTESFHDFVVRKDDDFVPAMSLAAYAKQFIKTESVAC